MRHDRYGYTTLYTMATENSHSQFPPMTLLRPLKNTVRKKILHYRQLYVTFNSILDPIVFMTVTVNTSGHLYDDFLCLVFFHVHRESSDLNGEFTRSFIPLPHFFHSRRSTVVPPFSYSFPSLNSSKVCLSDTGCPFIFEDSPRSLCIKVFILFYYEQQIK